MSRVELLAKAFNGTVIEDSGYRGVFQAEESGQYYRYHSTHGVHEVLRQPRVWRIVRPVLMPDEVRPFLEQCGLVERVQPTEKPLDTLIRMTGGEHVTTFHTGGGVLKVLGRYYRFSMISGLDIVEYVVSKWRVSRHIASRTEVMRAIQAKDVSKLFNHNDEGEAA